MPDPYIEIHTGDTHKDLPITEKPITIGRHPTNMVVLADGMASRYHCVIEKGQDGLRIRDLDSSNGTRVNGQVVKTWRLGDGDVVQIGKSRITVHAPALAAVRVPAPQDDDFEVEVVEVDDDEAEQDDAEMTMPGGGGYEAQLVRMAESLADKKFAEEEIALYNARGGVAHPATKAGGNGRSRGGNDAREVVGIFR